MTLIAAVALATSVHLEVPTREMEIGQQSRVRVAVVDGSVWSIPQLAADPGLEVQYLGQERFTRTSNLQIAQIVRFTYGVRAVEEGSHTLGPATVELGRGGADRIETDRVTIEVVPRSPPQTEPIVVSAEIAPETAWEGQVVTYTYGLRSRVRIARSSWKLPSTQALVRPRDGEPVRQEYVIDDPESPLQVDETTVPYLVVGSGDVALEPAVAFLDVYRERRERDWGLLRLPAVETVTLLTEPLELDVRPLPEAPPGFGGLVGDFDVQSRLTGDAVAVGESVDWVIEVQGDGSLAGYALPLPESVEGARLYEGTPEVSGRVVDGDYQATGRYSVVVVPTRPGPLRLPPLEVVAFSPEQGRYVTHRIEAPSIEVSPGGEGGATVESFAPGAPIRAAAEEPVLEIHPVYPRGRAHAAFLGPVLGWGLLLGGLAVAGVLLADALRWWRTRPRAVEIRQVGPLERLRRVPEGEEGLAVLDQALREAAGRRLGHPAEGRADLAALPPPLSEQALALARELDRCRFAGEAPSEGLTERVRELVRALVEQAA